MKTNILWIGAAVIITGVFATEFLLTQFTLRSSANDPQIQIATDASHSLGIGVAPQALLGADVDFGKSLAVATIIYDHSGNIIAGAGKINGKNAVIPPGVLKYTDSHSPYILTWQPTPEIRVAAVVVATKDNYVITARSLKQIEARSDLAFQLTSVGLGASLFVLVSTFLFYRRKTKR